MSDQTDEAIAARERTRERMEGDRPPAPPSPPPASPAHVELSARARLWDKLAELADLAIPVVAELVREAEEERAEAAERRARMGEARSRGR